jgi:hypothetical protein
MPFKVPAVESNDLLSNNVRLRLDSKLAMYNASGMEIHLREVYAIKGKVQFVFDILRFINVFKIRVYTDDVKCH